MILLSAALVLALPASSQPAVSFESALGRVRSSVMQTQKAQRQVRAQDLGSDLQNAASTARTLAWDADRLRWRVYDVRRQAMLLRRQRPPRRDPWFESNLRRLGWDMRDFAFRVQALETEVGYAERRASPDPTLAAPASNLVDEAGRLRSEIQSMVSEARWARFDLAAIGYAMEGWDLERESSEAEDSARDAASSAGRILDKVRAPQAP